jgi:hypothetical protein
MVSDRANTVMPWHVRLDQLDEEFRGDAAIGTTGRGMTPCFVDKVARRGIRLADLLRPEELHERMKTVLEFQNRVITGVYGAEPLVLKDCVDKYQELGKRLRDLGVRKYGVIRIDSAASPSEWVKDPAGNTRLIAQTWREACDVAKDYGERLAAEGEICWGGMHSWKAMVDTLEQTDRPGVIGFQADMAHTLLYTMGYNAPEAALLPEGFDWKDQAQLDAALVKMTDMLRPWTIDFHVAQNDGTVKGMGYHDKTGRHCMVTDPNGRLDITRHAGLWLRNKDGTLTKAFQHICWDGCMFPNAEMMKQQTWNDILGAMIKVRDAHGWEG